MGRPIVAALAGLLALATARTGAAQQGVDRYEFLYGPPVDVTLSDLTLSSVSYEGRAVRTKGRLDISNSLQGRGRLYQLRDIGAAVYITPVPELAGFLDSEGMAMLGQDVEVTGVFHGTSNQSAGDPTQVGGVIQFWKILGPPEKPTKATLDAARGVTLEALVSDPGRQEGKTVRVVGKFRGRNLYGDLPVRSQRDSSDWVIKDDLYAVWITGKKPKGDGFDLDAGLKRDTNKWLEVVGRVSTRGSVVYVQAVHVGLTAEPRPDAAVQAPPPPPEKPKVPPVIVFALPLDGDQEVARSARFFIQFSKDMDDSTFPGRVLLRYAGPQRPGDRPFDGMKLEYDGGRRALEVDPGDNLQPGRGVEILLLPGILDVDKLELVPRPEHEKGATLDMLRYRVAR